MSVSLFDIQFGINISPWENLALVPCLTELTKVGYNGVEVTHRTYRNYADRVDILKEIVDDVGIDVVSYALSIDFGLLERDSSLLDRFQWVANFIHNLGGRYIVAKQGMLARPSLNMDDQLLHFERVVTDFAGICKDSGVELIYQPTPESFVLSPDIMERVVELIYPLGARICFDVSDFMLMGIHPIQFLQQYFEAVSLVRMTDMKITKGKKSGLYNDPEFRMLGQGKVDLQSIWTYLQVLEYKGWVIAGVPEQTALKEGVEQTTRFLNKDMEVFLTNLL